MKRTVVLVVLALSLSPASRSAVCSLNAQHAGVTALAMRDKIDPSDPVSFQWWFRLRDTIAKSTRYCLVDDPGNAYIILSVIGSDTDPHHLMADYGSISFVAYFSTNAIFINHWLYVLGAATVDRYAEKALADLDHEVQNVPPALKPKE